MFRRFLLIALLLLVAGIDKSADADAPSLYIEGYTDRLSYLPGEEVALHISTPAGKYAIEIARLGAKREIVWSKQDLPGKAFPVPDDASSHGCRWPAALTLPIPRCRIISDHGTIELVPTTK